MKRYLLTAPAGRDLQEIKDYLVKRAGPTVTRRVMKDIRSALELLGSHPGIGHVREDFTNRPVKFWPIYSYLIVYNPQTKPIRIVRVLPGMRDLLNILH